MVSTILTLVVIPLGCIKAETALCQVAAAGCAPGSPLPEAILAAIAPVQRAAPARKPSRSFSNVLFTVWAKIAGALMMVFYAIRGIFLLLGQMFSRPAKPAPAAPPAPASAPVVHGGPAPVVRPQPAPAAATPGHPAVSGGPGVTKVITPAKATIVPPEPPKAPVAPPAVSPAAPAAANGKKKAAQPAAAEPAKPVREAKAVVEAPAVSTEGRAKASGRRGIRLKLIKPGENDSGLK